MELKSPDEAIVYILAVHNAAVGLSLEAAADALKGSAHVSSAASSLKVAANLNFALKQIENFDSILARFNMSDERFELLLSEANSLASKQYSSELPLHMKHVVHHCQGRDGDVPKYSSPRSFSDEEGIGGGEEDSLSIHSIHDEEKDKYGRGKEYDERPPGQDSLYLASSEATSLDEEAARIAEEERRAVAAAAAAEKVRIDEEQRREEETRRAEERRREEQRVSAAAAAAAAQDIPLDEDKDAVDNVDDGHNPLSYTEEATSDLAIPIVSALSANKNLLEHIQTTRANGYPAHEFLAVGKFDVHTPFLLAVTDVILMRRQASDVEPVGRCFARLSQTTQTMIAEAKKLVKKRKDREYVSLDVDAPAMDVLSALEKADDKASLPESKLCQAAAAAWNCNKSIMPDGESASKKQQWAKHTKYTPTTISTTLSIGHEVVCFRFLHLLSFSRIADECSFDKGDAAVKSNRALSLIRQLGYVFCDEDIFDYTILKIFEDVILPAMHSHETHRIQAIFVLSFLIEELVKAKRYGKEWRISERVRLSQTLDEAGGKEAIEDMIDAEEAMLLPGKPLRSYFVEMTKGKKNKPIHTNNGSKRRRRSMRGVLSAAAIPFVAKRAGVEPRHLVFSYLCSTVTNFGEDYAFLLDERLGKRGDGPNSFAEEKGEF